MSKTIRIGGASGFWGDSSEAPRQLIEKGNVDYLTFDYLAEVTMSILSKAQQRNDQLGYATDFITMLTPLLPEISKRGIKVLANAGGVNLGACQKALQQACEQAGLKLSIGIVEGDNLLPDVDKLRSLELTEMENASPLPEKLMSANAYLGAFPIAQALDAGADIVLTGRCVDSALVLAPLIHTFGWQVNDYHHLASGSLAGHLLECGAQVTGGNFTDWQDVAQDWHDMGYPIAEVCADGSFILSKPEGTGGLISRLTVAEQLLYEIGDPANYILPDVICDFSNVSLLELGNNRVAVTGAKGKAAPNHYKLCATYKDGYKCSAMNFIAGFDAKDKAQAQANALLKRMTRLFKEQGFDDFSETDCHFIGANNLTDATNHISELIQRIAVKHQNKDALELFAREIIGTALAMSTGRCGLGAGRAKVQPVVRLWSGLIAKSQIKISVIVDERSLEVKAPSVHGEILKTEARSSLIDQCIPNNEPTNDMVSVPLIKLAVARSGDKGDYANIGVIARRPQFFAAIYHALTPTSVKEFMQPLAQGKVERFEVPSLHSLNFLLHNALGGGGMASLRTDSQAKTYGQLLLAKKIPIPKSWLEHYPELSVSSN